MIKFSPSPSGKVANRAAFRDDLTKELLSPIGGVAATSPTRRTRPFCRYRDVSPVSAGESTLGVKYGVYAARFRFSFILNSPFFVESR